MDWPLMDLNGHSTKSIASLMLPAGTADLLSRRSFLNMRFVMIAVIAVVTLPVFAGTNPPIGHPGSKSACKARNSGTYNFCMKNARTSAMKKACKQDYKHNKAMCK